MIENNGRNVPKLVTAKMDKKDVFSHFLGLFPKKGRSLDSEKVRDERLEANHN